MPAENAPWIRLTAQSLWQAEKYLSENHDSPERFVVERHAEFLRKQLAEDRARLLNLHRRSGDK